MIGAHAVDLLSDQSVHGQQSARPRSLCRQLVHDLGLRAGRGGLIHQNHPQEIFCILGNACLLNDLLIAGADLADLVEVGKAMKNGNHAAPLDELAMGQLKPWAP